MKNHHIYLLLTLATATLMATNALAQVQVLDKPYRSAAPETGFELPIDARPVITRAAPPPAAAPAAITPTPTPVVPAPAPVTPPLPSWDIQVADGSLSKALMRWSRTARIPTLWEAAKDLPAINARYQGDYVEALEQVMRDSARSQYPLHACVYDNVVRILHVSQSCLR